MVGSEERFGLTRSDIGIFVVEFATLAPSEDECNCAGISRRLKITMSALLVTSTLGTKLQDSFITCSGPAESEAKLIARYAIQVDPLFCI